MEVIVGIQALIAWKLLCSASGRVMEGVGVDYGGMLEGMEASELLALMEKIQERLEELQGGSAEIREAGVAPTRLFVDESYHIRLGAEDGVELALRPLVKALFILFLKHPEGIRLKERERFETELNEIYSRIAPNVSQEDRQRRIRRMVDPMDNSFSEKASVLNARLERLFSGEEAGFYKIQGSNGAPRRVLLDPVMVVWK